MADRLESLFWPDGILPLYGAGSRLQFAWRRLRRGVSGAAAERPLTAELAEFSGTAAGEFLSTLFAALAQMPVERLSVAEGALLWAGAVRERAISPSGLDALLRHRYEQLNGESEDLGTVQSLTAQGRRLTGVLLQNGDRCSADYFLVEGVADYPHAAEGIAEGSACTRFLAGRHG